MRHPTAYNLGIMFRREHAPETLPDFARRTEDAGFDELWVVEDCFYPSGVASAATALACTDTLTVGLGIMPAVVRNPVFTAMEIATLARLHPCRFLPGIGHGVTSWMRQIGALPNSQMTALEEVTVTVKRLLAGDAFTHRGAYVQVAEAELVHPPAPVPPVSLGVIGPKSLALSGRVADGTILSEYSSPAYITWAQEQIAKGQRAADQNRDHRLTVFAFACAAETRAAAHRQLRPVIASALASPFMNAKLAAMGILPQVLAYRENGEQARLEAEMPDTWIDELAIAGTPEDWKRSIDRLVEAGAETVVVVPLPGESVDEIDRFTRHLQL
jgi:5,10-methylenetetrahydromethanopterin reductase